MRCSLFALLSVFSLVLLSISTISCSKKREIPDKGVQLKKYFKSWAGYSFPRRPVGPIGYADTEGLKSFYVAVYDENGSLIRFTKLLKYNGRQLVLEPSHKADAGSTAYFRFVIGDDGRIIPGEQLRYVDTEGMAAFLQGQANESGQIQVLTVVTTAVFFEDRYVYDSNRNLKSRELRKEDGSTFQESFDVK